MIRRAHPDEAGRLTAIAHEAKRSWGYPESWIEAWRKDLTVDREYLGEHQVFVIAPDAEPVGFYSLEGTGPVLELGHFWVSPDEMGHGIGRVMFEHALEQAAQAGSRELRVDSDPNASGFYERMGAVYCGEIEASMDGVPRTRPQYRFDLTEKAARFGDGAGRS